MPNKVKTKKTNSSQGLTIIYVSIFLIVLYIDSKIQDPFNSPKFWVLLLSAAIVSGYVFLNLKNLYHQDKALIGLLSIFLIFSLVSSCLSTNILVSFLGESQRKNGLVTYFALVLLLLYATLKFKIRDLNNFFYLIFIISVILVIYGFMQYTGRDFIGWNNPYNSIILTAGNPNFSSALMAILAVCSLGVIFNKSFKKQLRIFFILVFCLLFTLIILTESRQGLIAVLIGSFFYITVELFYWNRKIGIVALASFSVVGIFSVLGMLQVGPMTSLIYKYSISIRGHYWRAGYEMLKQNWLFGVGTDRYGAYFKQYREIEYPLKYGYEITSTNAHSVPIQFFATNGIFVGMAYVLLILMVIFRSKKVIQKLDTVKRRKFLAIVAAWLAYQSQSLISIDNLVLAIFGWVTSGIILGIYGDEFDLNRFRTSGKVTQPVLLDELKIRLMSLVLLVPSIVLVYNLHAVEKSMFQVRINYGGDNSGGNVIFNESIKSLQKNLVADYSYKIQSTFYQTSSGDTTDGIKSLEEFLNKDEYNLDGWNFLADFYEKDKKYIEAEAVRVKISKLDPWNLKNLLKLGMLYKILGQYSEMERILKNLNVIAPETAQTIQANEVLVVGKG